MPDTDIAEIRQRWEAVADLEPDGSLLHRLAIEDIPKLLGKLDALEAGATVAELRQARADAERRREHALRLAAIYRAALDELANPWGPVASDTVPQPARRMMLRARTALEAAERAAQPEESTTHE
jgi:hypothetical protein